MKPFIDSPIRRWVYKVFSLSCSRSSGSGFQMFCETFTDQNSCGCNWFGRKYVTLITFVNNVFTNCWYGNKQGLKRMNEWMNEWMNECKV